MAELVQVVQDATLAIAAKSLHGTQHSEVVQAPPLVHMTVAGLATSVVPVSQWNGIWSAEVLDDAHVRLQISSCAKAAGSCVSTESSATIARSSPARATQSDNRPNSNLERLKGSLT
jgi:hypothetical protein